MLPHLASLPPLLLLLAQDPASDPTRRPALSKITVERDTVWFQELGEPDAPRATYAYLRRTGSWVRLGAKPPKRQTVAPLPVDRPDSAPLAPGFALVVRHATQEEVDAGAPERRFEIVDERSGEHQRVEVRLDSAAWAA
ncbi:MAG TPA: hypothetical protein VKA84_14670, partial [Gemmatimonadaceae bacterium]|nr:hypothetical protein [Gemmatimonadaceae bacterium]